MPGLPSRFLEGLPPGIVRERRTSGVFGGDLYRRRPKLPGDWSVFEEPEPEMASQDSPRYVKGERVSHRKFGLGTIAAITGNGRELKATVDFDDEDVGRRQLLVAYAGLERGWEGA